MITPKEFKNKIAAVCQPLPGQKPYTNHRRVTVNASFDGTTLIQFLASRFPQYSRQFWLDRLNNHLVFWENKIGHPDQLVRAGNIITNIYNNYTEPRVDPDLELVYMDDDIWVIQKTAPMPIHSSGCYNKNSLVSILRRAFPHHPIFPVHRLDKDTSGILILACNKRAARNLQLQFENKKIQKLYLAKVRHQLPENSFLINAPISKINFKNGQRKVCPNGLSAKTFCNRLFNLPHENTSIILVRPITGRTNQIRVHLLHYGHPIIGDDRYSFKSNEKKDGDSPKKLHLHALAIGFLHPGTSKPINLITSVPKIFYQNITSQSHKNILDQLNERIMKEHLV